jgi:hypothetical protein
MPDQTAKSSLDGNTYLARAWLSTAQWRTRSRGRSSPAYINTAKQRVDAPQTEDEIVQSRCRHAMIARAESKRATGERKAHRAHVLSLLASASIDFTLHSELSIASDWRGEQEATRQAKAVRWLEAVVSNSSPHVGGVDPSHSSLGEYTWWCGP